MTPIDTPSAPETPATGSPISKPVIGMGIGACMVCCAPLLLSALAAIGLSTATAVAVGVPAAIVALLAIIAVLTLRRRATAGTADSCCPPATAADAATDQAALRVDA